MIRALLLVVLLVLAQSALAEKYPADIGFIDVTAAPYGAIPDDGLDDTAAIRLAISRNLNKHHRIYFPCGVYNVSDQLGMRRYETDSYWSARTKIEGESRECAIIKLADDAPGYTDPNVPRSFIEFGTLNGSDSATAPHATEPNNPEKNNAFNRGFQNDLLDITIDCGAGNHGVRCVDYSQAHNQGSIRDVTIKSSDPNRVGLAGIYMGRNWPGPAIIQNVEIEGFNYGMDFGLQMQQNMTTLDVTVKNQLIAGVNGGNLVTAHERLTSTQADGVPAFITNSTHIMFTIVNSTFTSMITSTRAAIETHSGSKFYLNNLHQEGYASVLKRGAAVVAPDDSGSSDLTELVSHPVRKLFNAPDSALNLTEEYAPEPYWIDPVTNPEAWANVVTFGAGNGSGGETVPDSDGFQAAIDSGAPIIYAPRHSGAGTIRFVYDKPIIVKPTTRRIILSGTFATAHVNSFPTPNPCVFVIEGDAEDPPVTIEDARRFDGATTKWFCNHSNGRTLVVTRMTGMGQLHDGPGKTFSIDNIGGIQTYNGHKTFAWQLNSEGASSGVSLADGEGTEFRIFGFKTERDFTQAEASNEGAVELISAFAFPCVGAPGGQPPVSIGYKIHSGGKMSIHSTQWCQRGGRADDYWPVSVQQTVSGTVRELLGSSLLSTGAGFTRAFIPMFVAAPADIVVSPAITDQTGNSRTFNVVQIDPTGVNGVNLDPGNWTQPADCREFGRAAMRVQKLGAGALDVDFWSCNDIGGLPIGTFDPAFPPALEQPTDCRNLTSKVIVDGIGEAPGTTQIARESGQIGQIIARIEQCDGDCSALLSLSCSGAADTGPEENRSAGVRTAVGRLIHQVNSALEEGLRVDMLIRVDRSRSEPITVNDLGKIIVTRSTYDSERDGAPEVVDEPAAPAGP